MGALALKDREDKWRTTTAIERRQSRPTVSATPTVAQRKEAKNAAQAAADRAAGRSTTTAARRPTRHSADAVFDGPAPGLARATAAERRGRVAHDAAARFRSAASRSRARRLRRREPGRVAAAASARRRGRRRGARAAPARRTATRARAAATGRIGDVGTAATRSRAMPAVRDAAAGRGRAGRQGGRRGRRRGARQGARAIARSPPAQRAEAVPTRPKCASGRSATAKFAPRRRAAQARARAAAPTRRARARAEAARGAAAASAAIGAPSLARGDGGRGEDERRRFEQRASSRPRAARPARCMRARDVPWPPPARAHGATVSGIEPAEDAARAQAQARPDCAALASPGRVVVRACSSTIRRSLLASQPIGASHPINRPDRRGILGRISVRAFPQRRVASACARGTRRDGRRRAGLTPQGGGRRGRRRRRRRRRAADHVGRRRECGAGWSAFGSRRPPATAAGSPAGAIGAGKAGGRVRRRLDVDHTASACRDAPAQAKRQQLSPALSRRRGGEDILEEARVDVAAGAGGSEPVREHAARAARGVRRADVAGELARGGGGGAAVARRRDVAASARRVRWPRGGCPRRGIRRRRRSSRGALRSITRAGSSCASRGEPSNSPRRGRRARGVPTSCRVVFLGRGPQRPGSWARQFWGGVASGSPGCGSVGQKTTRTALLPRRRTRPPLQAERPSWRRDSRRSSTIISGSLRTLLSFDSKRSTSA